MVMENSFNLCNEIISKVRWYMDRKDYNGLRLYLDQKEKSIEKAAILCENNESKYMDDLVKDLK